LPCAQHRMWLALEAGTHKEFKPLWDKYIVKAAHQQAHTVDEKQSLNRIYQKLAQLENALQLASFLCGDQIRYADIAWLTRLEQLNSIPDFTLQGFPALKIWHKKVGKLLDGNLENVTCR